MNLNDLLGWLLEAGGPLALLSAQLLYVGSPFLGPQAQALAQRLESGAVSGEAGADLPSGGALPVERR